MDDEMEERKNRPNTTTITKAAIAKAIGNYHHVWSHVCICREQYVYMCVRVCMCECMFSCITTTLYPFFIIYILFFSDSIFQKFLLYKIARSQSLLHSVTHTCKPKRFIFFFSSHFYTFFVCRLYVILLLWFINASDIS